MEAEGTAIGVTLGAFERHGDRLAIRHAHGDWTYADLVERIYRMARALRLQGLERGSSIALLTHNHPETFVLRYAANTLGACVTVLNDGLAPAIVAQMMRATDATTLVFAPELYDDHARTVIADMPGLTALSLGPSQRSTDLAALASVQSAEPLAVDASPQDLASIQLSGGSTGVPKGIPRDFRVRPFLTERFLKEWENTTQLLCTQLSRIGGMMADMVLAGGGRVVLQEQFEPGAVLRAIESEQISYISLLPSLLYRLLDQPEVATVDMSSLRTIAVGGRASSPQRIARAVEVFGPIIRQDYGASECGRVAVLTPQEHLRTELLGTAGRPLPGVEVSIRDASDAVVESSVTGEIWVRGPALMAGYYKMPEETAKVFRDGWYRTGDLGRLDAAGYLTVVGRTKEVVHGSRGKVYPAETESALLENPRIQDAVVFGTTLPSEEERLCAAVVTDSVGSLTDDDVEKWVTEVRGFRYAPEVVLFLAEIPLTGSQKPDVAALRRLVTEAGERRGES